MHWCYVRQSNCFGRWKYHKYSRWSLQWYENSICTINLGGQFIECHLIMIISLPDIPEQVPSCLNRPVKKIFYGYASFRWCSNIFAREGFHWNGAWITLGFILGLSRSGALKSTDSHTSAGHSSVGEGVVTPAHISPNLTNNPDIIKHKYKYILQLLRQECCSDTTITS